MAIAKCSDLEFARLWNSVGPSETGRTIGATLRSVFDRAQRMEKRGVLLRRVDGGARQIPPELYRSAHKARINCDITNGVVLVGSDAHIWPGEKTTAMRAFLRFIKDIKPAQVHLNGDVFDGAKISRHPKIGFLENAPSVREEIKGCQKALEEIEAVVPHTQLFWELGNHDLRFEAFLASHAPEYEGVQGFHLKDFFLNWKPCWSCHINPGKDGHTVIKHRFKGGKYDSANNIMNAHVHMVTGHTHAMKWFPMTTYRNHTLYGVNTGTLADRGGEQFIHYTEDNPTDWRSGFAVLTFWKGRLLMPELCEVISEDEVVFRGKVIEV